MVSFAGINAKVLNYSVFEWGSGEVNNSFPPPARRTKGRLKRDGLISGTIAPLFCVPRVGGGTLVLEEYLGRPILLVFSDPSCGPCNLLVPQLNTLHKRTPDIEVLLISRGDHDANLQKAKEFSLAFPIGLQRNWEVSLLYAMFATPIAYYIDELGVISADIAIGPNAILALLTSAAILSLLKTCPKPSTVMEMPTDVKESKEHRGT